MANLIWSNSSDDSDIEVIEKPEKHTKKQAIPRLVLESEEGHKVAVSTLREKRTKELHDTIKLINNSIRIRDVSKICDLFATFIQVFEKGKFNLKTDINIAKSYYKCLLEIKSFTNEQWESRAKLNKTNGRALNTLKHRWNKYTKDFQSELDAYKENPNSSPEPDVDEVEETKEPTPVASPVPVLEDPIPPVIEKFEEKDDSDWTDDTDSSDVTSSSDSDSDIGGEIKLTARHFLKSYTQASKASEVSKKRTTEAKEKKIKEETDDDKKGPKIGEQLEDLTVQRVLNEEDKILSLRGRTSERPTQLVDGLIKLQAKSKEAKLGDAISLRLCFRIISAIFDLKPGPSNIPGQNKKWELSLKYVKEVLEQLLLHPEIKLYLSYAVEDIESALEEAPVIGDPLMWVERLNDQLFYLLQNTDHNSYLYVERLRDDFTLFVIFELLENFLKSTASTPESFVRLFIMKLEHHYYKPSALLRATYYKDETQDPNENVTRIAEYIFEHDAKETYTRAVIYLVYYHAVNDNWVRAQDVMLTHRVQDTIQQYPKQVQILYNRVLAQLGICAFRHGHLDIAHDTLLDLISNSRLKEHLAQGFNPRSLDSEQEPIALKFILPYHLHISVELIECVYMCAAMIKEVPYMASKELETKKRLISRLFHNQLKNREKQLIVGPPDSSRDYIISAAYKMREGNWKECCKLVLNIRVWALFKREREVKDMLRVRIKETTLETYLYGFSQAFSSISLSSLSSKFELPESTVSKIVSQLISSHKLQASLDEPSRSIIIHSTQSNRLQQLSIRLSEKLDMLASSNQDLAKFKQIAFPQQDYQRGRH